MRLLPRMDPSPKVPAEAFVGSRQGEGVPLVLKEEP